ncbi:MAG: hypothetical protein KAX89_06205 [Propionivibrio sp.]|nr:hypothetical protein [Propionivibrio sp.]
MLLVIRRQTEEPSGKHQASRDHQQVTQHLACKISIHNASPIQIGSLCVR